MDEQGTDHLVKRVEHLEAEVNELRSAVTQLAAQWQAPPVPTQQPVQPAPPQYSTTPTPPIPPAPPPPATTQPAPHAARQGGFLANFDAVPSGGWWLNKAG